MIASSRERRLARRAAQGDRDALRELYEEYSEDLFAVAYRLTESSADARDVLHDVFSRLPRALRSYNRKGPLGPWLRAVTTRAALVRLRAERRRREVSVQDESLFGARRTPSVIDSIAFERALASLPEKLRTVIILKELQGYSHKEIGDLLGIPPSTSRGRLHTARAALRDALRDE
ncbi:RNA polymerase sigma factor [Candidatus Palauibacter sp.]|uniref:RNA polymerase sigma factor n=1 Tax=Candidatus Palauibacter sp. TaxID=3101350 RepID=UPI003B0117D4